MTNAVTSGQLVQMPQAWTVCHDMILYAWSLLQLTAQTFDSKFAENPNQLGIWVYKKCQLSSAISMIIRNAFPTEDKKQHRDTCTT